MSRAERWASRVLQLGGLVAVALMIVGLIGAAVAHSPGAGAITSIAEIRSALGHRPVDVRAISAIGFVVLCATPFVAVVGAGLAFYLDDDRRYTIIAAIVATGLLIGLWLGAA